MNYFNYKSAAERYTRGRLYFHPLIVGRTKRFLSITEPLSSALDVGCGTGLSTIALKEIARSVIGVDASAEMVALAPKDNGVRFLVASAENLLSARCPACGSGSLRIIALVAPSRGRPP